MRNPLHYIFPPVVINDNWGESLKNKTRLMTDIFTVVFILAIIDIFFRVSYGTSNNLETVALQIAMIAVLYGIRFFLNYGLVYFVTITMGIVLIVLSAYGTYLNGTILGVHLLEFALAFIPVGMILGWRWGVGFLLVCVGVVGGVAYLESQGELEPVLYLSIAKHYGIFITYSVALFLLTLISGRHFRRILDDESAVKELLNERIKQTEELNEQLTILATRDAMTGVYNRGYGQTALEKALYSWKRHKHFFCVIVFDIDFFKKVNDTYGHNTGDDVLRDTAHALHSALRAEDMLCRWGGEEFVLILHNTTLTESHSVVARIQYQLARVETEVKEGVHIGKKITPTASMGVAQVFEYHSNGVDLIKDADSSLYTAKHNGRNQAVYFQQPKS